MKTKYVVVPFTDGQVKFTREFAECVRTILVLAGFLAISISFYCWYEGWTIGSSLTFIIVTMSTVGYGYTYPSDDNSRLFTVFVMVFGVFGVYSAINKVVETRLATLNRAARKREADLKPAEIYRQHHRRLLLNIMLILASLFLAAGAFSLIEDMTFAQGLYFAVQTACTVGFGDVPLKRIQSQQLIGFYIIFSTVLMTFAFNNFKNLSEDFQRLKEAAEFAKRKKTLAKIKELDTGNGVPMDAFLLAVLEQLGVLDRERDLDPWIKKFKEIDADNSGFIDAEEIEAFSEQEKTLAAKQLAQMKEEAHRDNSLQKHFSTSFNLPFGLGFSDPLKDADDDSDGNDDDMHAADDDKFSDTSSSTDSVSRKGETMNVGVFKYLIFGNYSYPRHGLGRMRSHGHTGDLMPPDLKAQHSLTLSMDEQSEDELELRHIGASADSASATGDENV